jgi:hypothetical protein
MMISMIAMKYCNNHNCLIQIISTIVWVCAFVCVRVCVRACDGRVMLIMMPLLLMMMMLMRSEV